LGNELGGLIVTGKQLFVRSIITASPPLILTCAFVSELYRGIKSALRFACLDVQIEYESYKHQMRREDY
jgi:hypothetical protein